MDTANNKKAVLQGLGELDETQAKFVDDACLDRYLRARKNDVRKATDMLKNTLAWRKSFGIESLDPEDFLDEFDNGKFFIAGFDDEKRPVMLLRKRADRIDPEKADQYLPFLVHTLESTTRVMPEGVEQWVWIMDLNGYSRANSPPLSISVAIIRILANHFPERMRKCYVVNAPTIFSILRTCRNVGNKTGGYTLCCMSDVVQVIRLLFWGEALYPFIDPVTKAKVTFISSNDFDEDGNRVDGEIDETEFSKYFALYKTPYNKEKYLEMIKR